MDDATWTETVTAARDRAECRTLFFPRREKKLNQVNKYQVLPSNPRGTPIMVQTGRLRPKEINLLELSHSINNISPPLSFVEVSSVSL